MSRLRSAAALVRRPSEALRVDFFEPPLPPSLWQAYERAAQSYACTRAYVEHFEGGAAATLALVRPTGADEDRAAFLYRVGPPGRARLLGRFSAQAPEDFAVFVEALFARHPEVARIDTNLIDELEDARAIGRPALAVREATELRVALPSSVAEYEGMLSKEFLRHTRYHERRLGRECRTARFTTRERREIPPSWVADVVRLNRERMASKKTRSVFSAHYAEGIFRVAREHGAVTVLEHGPRVWAGLVDVYCGSEVFAWVIGHDNAYGKYRPGRLCQMAAIRHAIARGMRTIHFLPGEALHKREFGGTSAHLAAYVVLRRWGSLRPSDVLRLCRKHVARFARRCIAAGDRVAAPLLGGRTPLHDLARAAARRVRKLSRRA